jgi:hypothetical protein
MARTFSSWRRRPGGGSFARRPGWMPAAVVECSSLAVRTVCALLATVVVFGSSGVVAQAQRLATTAPETTFSAHAIHGGLAIDHMTGGEPTVLEPKGWFHWRGDPTLVMRGGRHPLGLWLVATGHVVVRDGITEDSPVIGRVEPSWDNNAIRLTLHPADGPPIQSDVFQRVGTGTGRSVLTRLVDISPEVSGTYQAAMRTSDGAEVGWLRVTIGGRPGSFLWQGDLPASVDEGLAAATAQALGSEVNFILDHVRGVSQPPERR